METCTVQTQLDAEGSCLGTCFIMTIQFTCSYMSITCISAYCIIIITIRTCVSPCGIVGVDSPELLCLRCMLGDHITSSFIK